MKYLILKGCAGLGNRLVTLSNAIEYCKRNERILYVDWSDGLYGLKGENIFYKYFKINNLPHVTSLPDLQPGTFSVNPKIWHKIGLNAALYDNYTYGLPSVNKYIKERFLPGKGKLRNARGYFYFQGKPYEEKVNYSNISYLLSLFNYRDILLGGFLKNNIKEDVVIFSDYQPKYYPQNLINHLSLTPDFDRIINNFSEHNKLNEAIGIHVRATDRKVEDALVLIKNKLSKIDQEKESSVIFLATDNKKLESEFSQAGFKVVTYPKFIPDIDLAIGGGIHHWATKNKQFEKAELILKESIIDIWLLSKCKYLLYMGNSSFSKIAVTLHNSTCIDWVQ
ncbi:hypothetical protein [Macellibacteroides fermentans]|uniref:hypothetical protein n=1 Tax=Macellibacteroides fermentans TaxID=879969 RepID=UPI00352D1E35